MLPWLSSIYRMNWNWKFSLALVIGWSNSTSTSVFTSPTKTLFSISLVKTPSNWDADVSSFSVVVTDLVFIHRRLWRRSRLWVQDRPDFTPGCILTLGKLQTIAVHFPVVSLSDSNGLVNSFVQTISVSLVLRYSGPLPVPYFYW